MTESPIAAERAPWFDAETGVVDRRIFARAWNFVCHESQLPEVGSFFVNWIGEDEVIGVRDRSGTVQVLLNSRRHRGNTVCRAEQGRTRSFYCSYHGWNYDLDGTLIGVRQEKAMLSLRVQRLAVGHAWAEDPPSRTRRLLTNIRILDADGDEIGVAANFQLYRTRLNSEEDSWIGRREDRLRREDGTLRIARRHVFLEQTVILSQNLSSFF